MATPRRRLAPGFLFVVVAVLVVLRLVHDRIVVFLSPYMGGKKVCVENSTNLPNLNTFGPKDGCVQIKQSAETLLSRIELGLLAAAAVLIVYVLVKLVINKTLRSGR